MSRFWWRVMVRNGMCGGDCQLSLDRLVVQFELECLLEICGWGNDSATRRRARTIKTLKK
jgi:hypothetical protein